MKAHRSWVLFVALVVGLGVGGCTTGSDDDGGGGDAGSNGGSGGAAASGGAAGSGGGGDCSSNGDCAATEYCDLVDCVGPGACVERPVLCPDVFEPVCGCDGETYGNGCQAAGAGVSIASDEACPCEGNDECLESEYCASDVSCDAPGACETRPTVCPRVIDPVCGCDGGDYNNACLAAAAGVRVESEGACP